MVVWDDVTLNSGPIVQAMERYSSPDFFVFGGWKQFFWDFTVDSSSLSSVFYALWSKQYLWNNYEWFSSQKNKQYKKRNFRSPLWETFLSIKAEVGMFTKLSTWWNPKIWGKILIWLGRLETWPQKNKSDSASACIIGVRGLNWIRRWMDSATVLVARSVNFKDYMIIFSPIQLTPSISNSQGTRKFVRDRESLE